MAAATLGAQVRPYRDYLTPVLHSRFNKASRYTLLLCYFIALVMGEWDSRMFFASPSAKHILTSASTMALVPHRPHRHPHAARLSSCTHHLRPPRCPMAGRRTPDTHPVRHLPKVPIAQVDHRQTRLLHLLRMVVWRGLHLVSPEREQAELHRPREGARSRQAKRETALLAPTLRRTCSCADNCPRL